MKSVNEERKKLILDEKDVLEYLKLNPGIFERHEAFLTNLNLHYDNHAVSSLVKKQLAKLRKKNLEQKNKYNELLQNAETNWEFITKIQNIIEISSKFKTLDKWITYLSRSMGSDFDADEVVIQVKIKANKRIICSKTPKNVKVGKLPMSTSNVYSGLLLNFHKKNSIINDDISSIVFYPIQDRDWSGYFYLGSFDSNRYSAHTESDLLTLLASVLKLSISMHFKGSI